MTFLLERLDQTRKIEVGSTFLIYGVTVGNNLDLLFDQKSLIIKSKNNIIDKTVNDESDELRFVGTKYLSTLEPGTVV